MQEIYNKSLNSSGNFDYTLCSRRCREQYAQTHEVSLPTLAVKEEVEMSETEELFTKLPAKTIIETSTGTKVATSIDIDKIQQIYQE